MGKENFSCVEQGLSLRLALGCEFPAIPHTMSSPGQNEGTSRCPADNLTQKSEKKTISEHYQHKGLSFVCSTSKQNRLWWPVRLCTIAQCHRNAMQNCFAQCPLVWQKLNTTRFLARHFMFSQTENRF